MSGLRYNLSEVWNPSIADKIYEYEEIPEVAAHVRRVKGFPCLLAPGVYDIMHPGHQRWFEEARKYGGFVFAGVENDEAVVLNKGPYRPVNPVQARLEMVAASIHVGAAFAFPDAVPYDQPEGHIARYRFLGIDIAIPCDDPNATLKARQAYEAEVGVVPIYEPLAPYSTTSILAKMGDPHMPPPERR